MRNTFRILARKPEKKRPLGEDYDIKMDLKEIGWKGEDLIGLSEDRGR
jgi:hypothetical protein